MNRPESIVDDSDWAACQPGPRDTPYLRAIKERTVEFHKRLDRAEAEAIAFKAKCDQNTAIALSIALSFA